jgi:hypothetical protein
MKLREHIEDGLKPLLGKRLWCSRRAADMEMFHFGARVPTTDGRGKSVEVGEYALHVQCAWRIVGPGGIVVGSRDVYEQPDGLTEAPSPEFDWEKGNRRDERMQHFLAIERPEGVPVESISGDDVGGFRLGLSNKFRLEVFPHGSSPEEHWRLLRPGIDTPHFVVKGSAVEELGREHEN